jgi:PAS domain S-box-containing protein
VRKDGSRFWASAVLTAVRDESGAFMGYVKITRDDTERTRSRQVLLESERRFRMLVDGVTDYAIFMLDPHGFVTNWNKGAQRVIGYTASEIIGQHFSAFYTEEDREAGLPARSLRTAAAEGKYDEEGWRVRKDGSRFWASTVIDPIFDEDGKLAGFAKVTRDVTERREAQEALERTRAALFHSQKMEVLGQLTGGIAHDFNNMLGVIVLNLDLLTRNKPGERERRLIEIAQHAAQRCAKLTEQLLAFARRQPLLPEIHDISALIRGFETVLRRACGEPIEVTMRLAPKLKASLVDPQQLESALLNLVVNARDAMPRGGKLTITTENVEIEARQAASMSGISAGEYVMIAIADTGQGMTPEVLAHAVEPFYTTKEVGKGSGLGLSQVYGFVTQSGGHVEIESAPGKGTTVKLYLPVTEHAPAEEELPDLEAPHPLRPATVLVVEDDLHLLEAAVETLQSLGYKVLTARDGAQALRNLELGESIDVLFTDVVMPNGMNGVELAREARRLRPSLRVLLASGYPAAAQTTQQDLPSEFSFIAKPYRWPELVDKIRALTVE